MQVLSFDLSTSLLISYSLACSKERFFSSTAGKARSPTCSEGGGTGKGDGEKERKRKEIMKRMGRSRCPPLLFLIIVHVFFPFRYAVLIGFSRFRFWTFCHLIHARSRPEIGAPPASRASDPGEDRAGLVSSFLNRIVV